MCREIARQAAEIRDDFRVELSLRGEPLLNPNVLENLRIIRQEAPRFQISLFTNGLRLKKIGVSKLLDSGVNILCVEGYDGRYDRFLKLSQLSGETVTDFNSFTAYKRHKNGHELRVVNLIPDIKKSGSVRVRQIHNNGGNVPNSYLSSIHGYKIKTLPLSKRCVRPFRELVVYLDGTVVVCCHDWKAECVLGNMNTSSLHEIWYGGKHLAVLKRLFNRSRSMAPCKSCDYFGGYRVGLLHNPTVPIKKPTNR